MLPPKLKDLASSHAGIQGDLKNRTKMGRTAEQKLRLLLGGECKENRVNLLERVRRSALP
jgi:hypothetical protein